MLCEDESGPGYLKLGRSCDISQRYKSLITGCPLPIKMVALLHVRRMEWAEIVEKAFHIRLEARKTRGEWFKFDFRSPEDKAEFKAVTKEVIALFPRYFVDGKWEIIDLASQSEADAISRLKVFRYDAQKRYTKKRKEEHLERWTEKWYRDAPERERKDLIFQAIIEHGPLAVERAIKGK